MGMGESLEESARFNPRTPCGVRHQSNASTPPQYGFQSTHSLWSATLATSIYTENNWFQSTHSLWSATDRGAWGDEFQHVSIHALLVECDTTTPIIKILIHSFNPRTPCGVRLLLQESYSLPLMFQSTHSLWSATYLAIFKKKGMMFQSTHSLWSATEADRFKDFLPEVSIHALLVECDSPPGTVVSCTPRFNPRTPCGVRLSPLCSRRRPPHRFQSTHSLWSATLPFWTTNPSMMFQSTHSLWSATPDRSPHGFRGRVSIHALLVECDMTDCRKKYEKNSFNPRTPCGVRPGAGA